MAERKPVLLAVDDDREVVRAVERDLRNHYARDFTVSPQGRARKRSSSSGASCRGGTRSRSS